MGFFARFTGGNGHTLPADLKRITECGVIDVPKDLLTVVIDASNDSDNRREIMQHLRTCLAETSGAKWKRVHASLVLSDELLQRGNPILVSEIAEGQHFDLVQRLAFLEKFELLSDLRVQKMVRDKASRLRKELVPRMQTASLAEASVKDTHSTGSPGAISTCSTATASTTSTAISQSSQSTLKSYSSENPELLPDFCTQQRGPMILNGMVRVGHCDDTTSESSGDDRNAKRSQRNATRKTRGERDGRRNKSHRSPSDSSCDSDSSPVGASQKCRNTYSKQARAPAATPVESTDLLAL